MIRQVQCTRPVPKCPLFYLTRGFPHCSYLLLSLQSTLSLSFPLCLSLSHTHAHALLFTLVVMSSPLYPRRLRLRSSSNTQLFARCQGQVRVTLVWNKRDGDKLELGHAAALGDGLYHGLVPFFSVSGKKKNQTEPWGEKSSDRNHYYYIYFAPTMVFFLWFNTFLLILTIKKVQQTERGLPRCCVTLLCISNTL